jgi:hypothetical protein
MSRFALRGAATLLALLASLSAVSAAGQHDDEPERWLTYYYRDPQPDRLTPMIAQLSARGAFTNPTAVPPLVGFMMELFRSHPERLAAWSSELGALPAEDRLYVWWALWNTQMPEALAALEARRAADPEGIAQVVAMRPLEPMSDPVMHPAHLDMLWGMFMATGDVAPVERVIDVLRDPLPKEGSPERFQAQMLQGAAQGSLASNAALHEPVERACRARLATATGPLRDRLLQVLQSAEERKRAGAAGAR